MTAQELHAALRSRGTRIGLTTVYRQLQRLAESGEVDVIRTDVGEAAYRRCRTERHHHHLVCDRCGRTIEIEGPTVERWAASVATSHGFTDVSHHVEVFGVCPNCRN